MRRLVQRGALDTLLQASATLGARFLLVAAVPVLALFVPATEVARFDLFLVVSTFQLIVCTLGVDSGLALSAASVGTYRRTNLLWAALAISAAFTLLIVLPSVYFVAPLIDLGPLGRQEFLYATLYGFGGAIMTTVFSFFRWIGRSVTASLLLLAGHVISIGAGLASLFLEKTILSFVSGLTVGALIGALLSLAYVLVWCPPLGLQPKKWRYWTTLIWRMFGISVPYCSAGILLLSRRFVDRGILLAFGSTEILGAYAAIARLGELIAFGVSLPAVGFSPLVLKEAATEGGKRLARLLFDGYVAVSVLIFGLAGGAWFFGNQTLFPNAAGGIASIFLAIIAGNLIFNQISVTGYGYILAGKTSSIAKQAAIFLLVYVVVAFPLAYYGHLNSALAFGFLSASLVYAWIFLRQSETLFSMQYRLLRSFSCFLAMAAIAVLPVLF